MKLFFVLLELLGPILKVRVRLWVSNVKTAKSLQYLSRLAVAVHFSCGGCDEACEVLLGKHV